MTDDEGANAASLVSDGDRAARLTWLLGPASAVPTLDDDAGFDTILDQLGELGLWEGLDEPTAAVSRSQNLNHQSWRWGALSPGMSFWFDAELMLEEGLDPFVDQVRPATRAVGLDLVVDHGAGLGHPGRQTAGFRAWINDEPLTYGPDAESLYRVPVLINWLADRAGIGHRFYLSGEFLGWAETGLDFDWQTVFWLSRAVAELIQDSPLLPPSQRLVPLEELVGQVENWRTR